SAPWSWPATRARPCPSVRREPDRHRGPRPGRRGPARQDEADPDGYGPRLRVHRPRHPGHLPAVLRPRGRHQPDRAPLANRPPPSSAPAASAASLASASSSRASGSPAFTDWPVRTITLATAPPTRGWTRNVRSADRANRPTTSTGGSAGGVFLASGGATGWA